MVQSLKMNSRISENSDCISETFYLKVELYVAEILRDIKKGKYEK
jgi:hypothetical protein